MITPEALSALRDRLIAATGPSFELDRLLTEVTGYPNVYRNDDGTIPFNAIVADFTSSVDAALGLVTRLLPGFGAHMGQDPNQPAFCFFTRPADGLAEVAPTGFAATFPLAILIALTDALSQPGVQS